MRSLFHIALVACMSLLPMSRLYALGDTLRVMCYNVLYYGDTPPCQEPHDSLHACLSRIVDFARPDLLGLVKMESYPLYSGDHSGSAPVSFPDSVLAFALEPVASGRYGWCVATNNARSGDMQVLFYNKQKLGFLGVIANYVNINDFTTYKFYYRSALISSGHDTVFLYITLNHTESGSGSAAIRQVQINGVMNQLQGSFSELPNLINMGDFNFHNTSEGGYQRLVNPTNTGFSMYDPPFFPDGRYAYPANWDATPAGFAGSLTTSTRRINLPNACGSTGGGKSWYDHIFISRKLLDNGAGLKYLANSYTTIGNDGRRTGKSINDTPANNAAPAQVIDALFRMSNKYPVMLSLLVDDAFTSVAEMPSAQADIRVPNPIGEMLTVYIGASLTGRELTLEVHDMAGSRLLRESVVAGGTLVSVPAPFLPGIYMLKVCAASITLYRSIIIKTI